jgi:hypothetical protein
VLFVLWLAFLALYALGDDYCFDAATQRSGIDALGHCASHHPLGLVALAPVAAGPLRAGYSTGIP